MNQLATPLDTDWKDLGQGRGQLALPTPRTERFQPSPTLMAGIFGYGENTGRRRHAV